MEPAPAFHVTPAEGETPGAFACFPYDGALVERFRKTFPRARWQPDEACWFVPGSTAPRRLDRWIAQELNDLDRHADAKGRDAYAFHPLASPYLLVGEDLSVRTPYSRTVVEIMRAIPWARWDPEQRLWRAPFRSYEELRRRWPEIEAAALRNEPEARRQRQRERKAADDGREARLQAERRRRRYPVRTDDPPPLDWPVATHGYGVVLFEEVVGEVVDAGSVAEFYPHLAGGVDHVWARWRLPTLEEVNATWPTREPEAPEIAGPRGWWRPSRAELQERRRVLRATERAQRTRTELRGGASGSAER